VTLQVKERKKTSDHRTPELAVHIRTGKVNENRSARLFCFTEPVDGIRLAQVLTQRENRRVGPSKDSQLTPASLVSNNLSHELTLTVQLL